MQELAHVTRVRTELKELKIKRNALKHFLPKSKITGPKRYLMEAQVGAMDSYIRLLTERLELE